MVHMRVPNCPCTPWAHPNTLVPVVHGSCSRRSALHWKCLSLRVCTSGELQRGLLKDLPVSVHIRQRPSVAIAYLLTIPCQLSALIGESKTEARHASVDVVFIQIDIAVFTMIAVYAFHIGLALARLVAGSKVSRSMTITRTRFAFGIVTIAERALIASTAAKTRSTSAGAGRQTEFNRFHRSVVLDTVGVDTAVDVALTSATRIRAPVGHACTYTPTVDN
jgi:hypothetical protein